MAVMNESAAHELLSLQKKDFYRCPVCSQQRHRACNLHYAPSEVIQKTIMHRHNHGKIEWCRCFGGKG